MNRTIYTLSITLFLSFPYMLEARPDKEADGDLLALITQRDALQKQYTQTLSLIDKRKELQLVALSTNTPSFYNKIIKEEEEGIASARKELQTYSTQLHELSIKIKAMKDGWIALDTTTEPPSGSGWLSWLW